jgi:hypothetical protein
MNIVFNTIPYHSDSSPGRGIVATVGAFGLLRQEQAEQPFHAVP